MYLKGQETSPCELKAKKYMDFSLACDCTFTGFSQLNTTSTNIRTFIGKVRGVKPKNNAFL